MEIPVYRNGEVYGVTVIDEADAPEVMQHRWRITVVTNKVYAYRHTTPEDRATGAGDTVYLHRFIMRAPRGFEVDHIDGDGLHNFRSNMRLVTHAQNMQNQMVDSKRTSRFRGVYWDRASQRWIAQGKLSGRRHYLGAYRIEEEAAGAAASWRRLHMPFAIA